MLQGCSLERLGLEAFFRTSRSCLGLDTLTSRSRLGLGFLRLVYIELQSSNWGLTLDFSSSRIRMAALSHTSTPFCFVIRQLLGFFPGQVHLSEVSFDEIYPVLPRSSWLSLVTSQFPLCCPTSSSIELSILITCPSHLSLLSLIISFSFLEPVFFLMSSFLTLSLHVIPSSLLWNLWWAASNFFTCVTDDSAPYNRV